MPLQPYNPLEKLKIADNILRELLLQGCCPLSDTSTGSQPPFKGAGIYALYYFGPFPAYQRIANANANGNWTQPIYVGKADPQGGRKGALELDASVGTSLYRRLAYHAKSISQAGNLEIEHFYYRSLVVDAVWISLGERRAIQTYKPVWNTLVDGFGNHDPGGRRVTQYRSDWDTLHPGRDWAVKLALNPRTEQEIIADVIRPHTEAELEQRAIEKLDDEDA